MIKTCELKQLTLKSFWAEVKDGRTEEGRRRNNARSKQFFRNTAVPVVNAVHKLTNPI